MSYNFCGENLRGRSFKGSDLTGADFSYADIRSTDFTGAILRETKFCHVKAGLQRRWAIFLIMVSCLLGGISGFFSGCAGAMVSLLIFNGENFSYQVAGWASLVVLVVYLKVIIRFGIQASVATVAGGFAVAIGGIIAFPVASFVGGEFA